MSRPLAKFKDVAQIVTGSTPKKVDGNYNGTVPFVTPGDLGSNALISNAKVTVTEKGAKSGRLLPKGTVMVCCIGATIGKVGIAERDVISNQQINSLIFDELQVYPKYGYYFCLTIKPLLLNRSSSTTMPIVNKSNFSEFEIPLPPLDEQKRIAAILDKADAIRRKRQQAIQLADDFLRSVFLDMFGEHFTTDGYKVSNKKKIKDLVDYIDYRGRTPQKSDSGIPLITAKNVKKGFVSEEPREFIPEKNYLDWMTRGLPREGDVLFTTEAPLGNAALLGCYDKVVVGQRLIALRSKGELTQEYLLYCLLNQFIQDEIYKRSSGSTVKGIRTKELYEIELPIPDIKLQKKFSKVYKKFVQSKHRLQGTIIESDNMFNSLSQKAFAG